MFLTFEGNTFYVLSVVISPDSNYVVSGSFDKDVKLWDFSTGTLIKTFEGHKKEVNSVVLSPDNKYIISGSSDKTIKIWELQ